VIDLVSEFQAVSDLYHQLGDELGKIDAIRDPMGSRAYLESIFQKRDCLARIEQMNSRARQLSDEWEKCRSKLDAKSRKEIGVLAETVRGQATRLHELCGTHIRAVQAVRDRLGRDLAELGKRARYLKSVKSAKNNYPKFIDSLC